MLRKKRSRKEGKREKRWRHHKINFNYLVSLIHNGKPYRKVFSEAFRGLDEAESYERSRSQTLEEEEQQRNPSSISQIAHKFNKNNISLFRKGSFEALFFTEWWVSMCRSWLQKPCGHARTKIGGCCWANWKLINYWLQLMAGFMIPLVFKFRTILVRPGSKGRK